MAKKSEIQNSSVTYAARESTRTLPVNYDPKDEILFGHEVRKQIPGCHAVLERAVNIVDSSLFRAGGFGSFSRYCTVGTIGQKDKIKRLLKTFQILNTPRTITRGSWVIDNWSDGYFHWFTDALTRVELVNAYWNVYPVILPRNFKSIGYVTQSFEILGVPYTFIEENRRSHVKELLLTSHTAPTGNYNKALLNNLARRFRNWASHLQSGKSHQERTGRRLFISRTLAPKRKISNEQELVPILRKYGFEIIHAENLTFKDQVVLFNTASVIAGLHGAGLTNMLFMPIGSRVIEIRRDGDSHNNCFFTMASDLEFDYYYLLAAPQSTDLHSGDCQVDPIALSGLLSSI